MSNGLSAIEHVVVLMFENRSFDHIFGALTGVNGILDANRNVNSAYYNLPHPTQPVSPANLPVVPTPIDASYQLPHDFNHDFGDGMMPDRFGPGTAGFVAGNPVGAPAKTYPSTNSGFLSTLAFNVNGHPPNGPTALTYFEAGSLQVLHSLAQEFVLCDNWFCDMPGHTLPNRAFMHCATTGGVGIDDTDTGEVDSKTIFELLEEQNKTWKMYVPGEGQLDTRFLNPNVRYSPNTNIPIGEFAEDAQQGTLPFYSFLMCWMKDTNVDTDTSMHPNSQIEPGENYLAAVYNTLRNSRSWENTLLIVTFDENGGMYDHVAPPLTVQPVPGPPASEFNNYGQLSQFDFTMLGFRIPVLVISPWLAKGIDSTQYQTTSILRFLEDLMAPGAALALTNRDAAAPTLASVFDQFGLPAPRTDCPQRMPTYPNFPFSSGNIDNPQLTQADAARAPLPHMVEITKEYSSPLPGHADSGKPIDRDFPTNAALDRYSQQRDRAAFWYDHGIHLQASLQVLEQAPGLWTWELKDPGGSVLNPGRAYQTRELALEALDRVRFLFHELCYEP